MDDLILSIFSLLFLLFIFVILAAIIVIPIYSMWMIFQKMGYPGGYCLIPFYSNYILFQKVFGNGWLFLIALIPCVGVFIYFPFLYYLGKVFGKSDGFCVGMIFIAPILMFFIALDKNCLYQGPINSN